MRTLVTAAALCGLASCSLLVVHGPDAADPKRACTTDPTVPIAADLALGLASGGGTAVLTDLAATGNHRAEYLAADVGVVALTALFLTSIAVGYSRASDCRASTD